MIPCLVVLNERSHGGAGPHLYAQVASEIDRHFEATLVRVDRDGRWRQGVADAVAQGVTVFIAAGGDGTVNGVVSALVDCNADLSRLVLGAIGLGSSNDFHKPFTTRIQGIPVRIDVHGARPRDIVMAHYEEALGSGRISHPFVVSASLGATAQANAFFNRGDWLLRGLRRFWTAGAIAYAAIRTLAHHHGHRAIVRWDERCIEATFSNLSILKTPYLSGAFRYDTPIEPASGAFALNYCEEMSRWSLVSTLVALSQGKFVGRPRTGHAMVRSRLEITLDSTAPLELELDGEIVMARRVTFKVWPERIAVCR